MRRPPGSGGEDEGLRGGEEMNSLLLTYSTPSPLWLGPLGSKLWLLQTHYAANTVLSREHIRLIKDSITTVRFFKEIRKV